MIKRIQIGKRLQKKIDRALDWKEGDDISYRLDEDETITVTAVFDGGEYEADIKCCGCQMDENSPGNNCAWTEGVLFKNGAEVACTQPSDDFFGMWQMEHDGKPFIVVVER